MAIYYSQYITLICKKLLTQIKNTKYDAEISFDNSYNETVSFFVILMNMSKQKGWMQGLYSRINMCRVQASNFDRELKHQNIS